MGKNIIDRSFGRKAFGADPAGYHAMRPDYPAWVFETLQQRCGVGPDTIAFEIGAGTGKATRHILDLGVIGLTAVEPDQRMAAYLRETIPDETLEVVISTFEEVDLKEQRFDLGVSTVWHVLHRQYPPRQRGCPNRAGPHRPGEIQRTGHP